MKLGRLHDAIYDQMIASQNAGMDLSPWPDGSAPVTVTPTDTGTNWGTFFTGLAQAVAPIASAVTQYKVAQAQITAANSPVQRNYSTYPMSRLYPGSPVYSSAQQGGGSIMPILLIGGAALAAFLLLRK